MQTDRAIPIAHPSSPPRVAASFKADPLRQRYLRVWIRMHLAQEYESRISGDPGWPLTAEERRRLVCHALFSVWRQAQEIGLRLPPMRDRSLPLVERPA
ncbi:MAG: hypothetical protein EPO21_14340 [Chloroflexota bacterium]|nr:MAG: hypothetical protein EPO21_14340 [Chloroflexota bacterium]